MVSVERSMYALSRLARRVRWVGEGLEVKDDVDCCGEGFVSPFTFAPAGSGGGGVGVFDDALRGANGTVASSDEPEAVVDDEERWASRLGSGSSTGSFSSYMSMSKLERPIMPSAWSGQ